MKHLAAPQGLPLAITARYKWLPPDVAALMESLEEVASPDDKSWLLTVNDFSGASPSAYAWNEWEVQSLAGAAAADQDQGRATRIENFWAQHFPIVMSLKSGYAYFAIESESLEIVVGEEPEFEEVSKVASNISDFLEMILRQDLKIARWI
ncbi:hypothetical protein LZC95_08360 [Pendulispora brunnea]|uniref:Knr4/Smi1-like domain-containing protein n=1 Tax=Pendulispora brunnea TaxID=2905690 RepID=A0ABZ2KHQ4_9BACT